MTAPDTNLSRQRRRHRWPLLGIFLSLALVGVVALVLFSRSADEPAGAVNPVMSDEPAARGSAAEEAVGPGGGAAGAPEAADGN